MGKKKSNRSGVQNRNVRHLVSSPKLSLKLLKLTALRPIQGFAAPQTKRELLNSVRRDLRITRSGARRKGVGKKNQSMVPDPQMFPIINEQVTHSIKKPVCVSRSERREVLFASKRVGKGSGNKRSRRFTENSNVRC